MQLNLILLCKRGAEIALGVCSNEFAQLIKDKIADDFPQITSVALFLIYVEVLPTEYPDILCFPSLESGVDLDLLSRRVVSAWGALVSKHGPSVLAKMTFTFKIDVVVSVTTS